MDRFIPVRPYSLDLLSPASPVPVSSVSSRGTASGQRRRHSLYRSETSADDVSVAALTWVVGAVHEGTARPGPIVHAQVLRAELLGGGAAGDDDEDGGGRGGSLGSSVVMGNSSGLGGGGDGGGVGGGVATNLRTDTGSDAFAVDVTAGWNDVSISDAPETAAGAGRHALPRLAAAATAAARARARASRAITLTGSPARSAAGGAIVGLLRDDSAILAAVASPGGGGDTKENAPLDGTSHAGVLAAAVVERAAEAAGRSAGTNSPGRPGGSGVGSRVLHFSTPSRASGGDRSSFASGAMTQSPARGGGGGGGDPPPPHTATPTAVAVRREAVAIFAAPASRCALEAVRS